VFLGGGESSLAAATEPIPTGNKIALEIHIVKCSNLHFTLMVANPDHVNLIPPTPTTTIVVLAL
jgi:hypothetical protein